jgi:hypothetical protein
MGQAFLLTLAIVWIHTGIALGARWSEISTGLPPGAVQADAADVYFADSLNRVIRVLRPINDPF